MKKVANDCKAAAMKLFTPNTNPCLFLLTHLAISELGYEIIKINVISFRNTKYNKKRTSKSERSDKFMDTESKVYQESK